MREWDEPSEFATPSTSARMVVDTPGKVSIQGHLWSPQCVARAQCCRVRWAVEKPGGRSGTALTECLPRMYRIIGLQSFTLVQERHRTLSV